MRVAIIPARGGSRRIPRKNIREFHGKPIIAYSIETALRSGLFDEVVVSTDDLEIGKAAAFHKARPLPRPPALACDEVGTQDVMRHALREIAAEGDCLIDYACCIYATCPLLTVEDLERGWTALLRNPTAQYAFAVAEEPFGPAGYFYFGRAEAFLNDAPLVAEHSVMVPIPPERCVDINTEADWMRAEELYAAMQGKP